MHVEGVGPSAHHLACAAVVESEVHVVVDLVDAPEPVAHGVHDERARPAHRQRLQHRRRHTAQDGAVRAPHVAEHAHADHDARLPDLVGGARNDVAQQEDAVDEPQVLRVLGAHVLTTAPAHLDGPRRQLAAWPLLVVVDVVLVDVVVVVRPTLLVTAVGRALDDADVVNGACVRGEGR